MEDQLILHNIDKLYSLIEESTGNKISSEESDFTTFTFLQNNITITIGKQVYIARTQLGKRVKLCEEKK